MPCHSVVDPHLWRANRSVRPRAPTAMDPQNCVERGGTVRQAGTSPPAQTDGLPPQDDFPAARRGQLAIIGAITTGTSAPFYDTARPKSSGDTAGSAVPAHRSLERLAEQLPAAAARRAPVSVTRSTKAAEVGSAQRNGFRPRSPFAVQSAGETTTRLRCAPCGSLAAKSSTRRRPHSCSGGARPDGSDACRSCMAARGHQRRERRRERRGVPRRRRGAFEQETVPRE